ncbi:MAG: rRNA pseudouridine synthase [Oscillospiraceae bacterium]|nr:rRNA pseudouridine synthase [Oscillospiraceae bacterium]
MEERLQKLLSLHGAASRREAETMIREGRVTVNGVVATLGMKADDERDVICVDSCPLSGSEERVYILLNKPRGCLCTRRDEQGRKTVLDYVRGCPARVWPVGRLDRNSEGLLLLTNDGELTYALTHPSHGVEKVYTVRVEGSDIPGGVKKLGGVLELEDGPARARRVRILRNDGARAILEITVTEGRKHLVRNLCAAAGLEVKRLIRVSEGGLALGDLRTGCWRELTEEEVRLLRRSSGR